jgi:hypothetical protein
MSDHEKLTDEERSRVHVNRCVRESELDEARAMVAAAEPGTWRVVEDAEVFRLTRHDPKIPLAKRESFILAAASVRLIPRLLGGIEALERALKSAWSDAACFRRELVRERDAHAATVKRQSEGKTGPEHELEMLAEYVMLAAAGDVTLTGTMPAGYEVRTLASYTRSLLSRWAGGASIAGELRGDVMTRERQRVDERAKFRAEEDAKTEELRRQLREAIEKVARGEIPEVLKPALKEAKKRAKSGG